MLTFNEILQTIAGNVFSRKRKVSLIYFSSDEIPGILFGTQQRINTRSAHSDI